MTRTVGFVLLGGLALSLAACRDKKPENLAPAASALAPVAPAVGSSRAYTIQTSGSRVSFLMEAPIEKISGDAPSSVEGELNVDPEDLAKSNGLVRVDLEKLSLYQEKREDEKGAFSERTKNETQNKHARTWLEISEDTPEAVRQENRFAEFRINELAQPSSSKLSSLPGPGRTVTATAVGDFRLHGRKNQKRVQVELTFTDAGDKPPTLKVRTLEPLRIGLDEYDVRPREAFGKLAQKTLGALGSKVAKEAPIQVEFSASAK